MSFFPPKNGQHNKILLSTFTQKMSHVFDFCVVGAGLFGSACGKYAADFGDTVLIGPGEQAKFQALMSAIFWNG
jgi:hypothetical protein